MFVLFLNSIGISLFVRDNAAHIIPYIAFTVNAITMSVDYYIKGF